jgi:hypothetical protein
VWRSKPEGARKLYPAIRRVFDRARVILRDERGVAMLENPARSDDLKALGFETPLIGKVWIQLLGETGWRDRVTTNLVGTPS